MLSIINYLHVKHDADGNDIYSIMSASNACFPDTSEVVEMLAYLTSFGQVKEIKNGWIKLNKQEYSTKKLFRERYLAESIQILSNLDDQAKNTSEIEKIISDMKKDEVEEYLKFLQKITAYGYVKKCSNGWKLENFEQNPHLESVAE